MSSYNPGVLASVRAWVKTGSAIILSIQSIKSWLSLISVWVQIMVLLLDLVKTNKVKSTSLMEKTHPPSFDPEKVVRFLYTRASEKHQPLYIFHTDTPKRPQISFALRWPHHVISTRSCEDSENHTVCELPPVWAIRDFTQALCVCLCCVCEFWPQHWTFISFTSYQNTSVRLYFVFILQHFWIS